jgi:hypothetical protein
MYCHDIVLIHIVHKTHTHTHTHILLCIQEDALLVGLTLLKYLMLHVAHVMMQENVSSSEDISAKTKSVIELKKLQLLDLQRRLRRQWTFLK